jgi:hypothetical protein
MLGVFVFFCLHMRTVQLVGGALAVLLALASSLPAENLKTCASAESRQAGRDAGHLQDWESVYRSYKRFEACDQGKVAEEYSYAISRLLAHHWEQVDVLLGLAAEDQEFKQFVLRHIDENIPEEEAQLIVNHSRQHCPTEGKWLCRAIVDY